MKKNFALFVLAGLPVLSFAANNSLENIIEVVKNLFSLVMPLILTLAVIYFVWTLVNYIRAAGENKKEALDHMIWGIVILFVMVSVWGLVNVLKGTTDLDNSVPDVEWEID